MRDPLQAWNLRLMSHQIQEEVALDRLLAATTLGRNQS
jgi:hypothetical protein